MQLLSHKGIDLHDYFAAQALSMRHMRTVPVDQQARKANDIADYMVAEKEYRFAKRSQRQFINNTTKNTK